jgi:hypothetical protein
MEDDASDGQNRLGNKQERAEEETGKVSRWLLTTLWPIPNSLTF